MDFTTHERRGESVGTLPSIPRTPPRSSGFRSKLHALRSSARDLLCFHPPHDTYEDYWPSNNKVALHMPAGGKSAMSKSPSRDTTAPWYVVCGRSYQVHTEKVAKHEGRQVVWDDKMSTTTKFPPPGSELSSEVATSSNAPPMEESGARRPGSANPLYDDYYFMAAPPYFNRTHSRVEGAEPDIDTGDTIEGLIDARLEIAYSDEECDSVASLGTWSLGSEVEGSCSEKAIDDESMVCGVEEGEEKTQDCWAGAWEEGAGADARRAWEDMKRRVMDVEEFGALPLDGDGAGDPERALRDSEFRARRRSRWVQEVIQEHVREEASRGAAAKKLRRHAGCWVLEDGVFVRLPVV